MSTKRVNVLVYAGNGATASSVAHVTWSLRRLLGPNYAVVTVTGDQIIKEPWTASCALLVMPGGADLAYCRTLNGEGNRRIKQYVQTGGAYLGLCAGGYYGAAKCEFEVGKPGMEVVGDRELAFYPGTCRGLAFSGFKYQSEAGAKAVGLQVRKEALADSGRAVPDRFASYYNGGGVFVDAKKLRDKGVEVLADFSDKLDVNSGEGTAAVVYCKVAEGGVILTGPHPEYVATQMFTGMSKANWDRFAGVNLNRDESSNPDFPAIIDTLTADDQQRTDFLKACLAKLGLEVSQETLAVPSLSRLHLSSSQPYVVSALVRSWQEKELIVKKDGEELIRGENDTFCLEQMSRWNMSSVAKSITDLLPQAVREALPTASSPPPAEEKTQADQPVDRILDYDKLVKRLVVHEGTPDYKETPHFNHHAFYVNLNHFNGKQHYVDRDYGKFIMYGEVVTSTQTMLERNPTWLAQLPTGFVAVATTQTSGRGRGTNVWVSPPGTLMFSMVMRHSLALSKKAPVTFIQYLAAMAIVAGVQNYDRGYEKIPIRLKWPNDVYAQDPNSSAEEKKFVKIGGILVNSSYSGGDYTVIPGIGLNVTNSAPTTSLSLLARKLGLPPMTLEKLLAAILSQFETLYNRFRRTGFDRQFEEMYYKSWLHTDQIVTLETEGGTKARIKGITSDWGLLVAEELGWEDRPTGKRWELQSDSNSFDFFKGLLKKKI